MPYMGISHLNEYETFTGLRGVLHRQSALAFHWIQPLTCVRVYGRFGSCILDV